MLEHSAYRLSLLAIFLLAGCNSLDMEELALLRNDDPEFRNMIQMKNQSETEIQTAKNRLAEYKATLDAKIQDMKTAYQKEKERMGQRVGMLSDKVAHNRELMSTELDKLTELLERKKRESADVVGALSDINNIMGRQDTLNFSPRELQNLQERQAILQSQAEPMAQEVDELTSRTNMLKKKLKYL